MSEVEEIRQRYERRKRDAFLPNKYPAFSDFVHFSRGEREYWYGTYMINHFGPIQDRTVLEIGAGTGDNLNFLRRVGFKYQNVWANDLLPDRVDWLKTTHYLPNEQILPGDAAEIDASMRFDVVFQSTVFTSILDDGFQQKLADKMWSLVKPGGMVLWYDFVFNNPNNPDVRGVNIKRVKELFPKAATVRKRRVTLAPPIGRRVGRLYPYLNWPILRTHLVASLTKNP